MRLAWLLFMLSTTAYADTSSWVCRLGTKVREIEVISKSKGVAPCRVVYKKPTEKQADRTVMHAQVTGDLCPRRAESLAAALMRLGWSCDFAEVEVTLKPKVLP